MEGVNLWSNFTNVMDDDLSDSQPLSLPSSSGKEPTHAESRKENIFVSNDLNKPKRPERGTGQKGHLRSIEEIDEKYRDVFKYPYFNIVQSRVIDDALYSDKSLVVCAPTGSGKTLIFEMAIVQLLMEIEEKKIYDDFKIIYMAPVKSLCTERLTEWYSKFMKLGLLSIEVTGDTDVDFPQLKPYRIIITTPEKWDMLTRRWKDHTSLVNVIKLFLIDEVHILNDNVRGPVLEAVVSRMKTIESSAKTAHRLGILERQFQNAVDTIEPPAPKIRFVAVSATVSNPEDVATWLGTTEQPAVFYKFGDECRPVKLKVVVEGYPCAVGSNIFKFDIILNYKLWPIIKKYHNGKPTLIFCNTRKSVALTAETLSREITVEFSNERRARLTALATTIKNKKLQSLILCGVGCHHAGLLYEERVNIENAFRNKDLPILITTTTLAMGVNLPAHLVIVKNTQQYMNGAYQEYSISTILQMVGRAGRPQFDSEATAVIMTRMADKVRYQSLVGGCEPLQSYLHKRLAENLNSEVALKTVTDVAECVQWVNSTFLSVRAARDPRRYLGLPQNASKQHITTKIEELCVKAMNGLATSGLITMDEATCIQSTDAGRLMSVYYIDVETMKAIMKIEGTETLEKLLWLVCESHELSDMHLRVDERRTLNALNRNNAAATIRFQMKGKINSRQMKLNCIVQAVLGCLPIPDASLNQEAIKVIRTADRVCKCLVAYVTSGKVKAENPQCFSSVVNAVILAKCVSAHLWENSPYLSKQLQGIGPAFSSLLASAGKTTFMLLEESHPRDLERIMNKGAPAGNDLRKQISLLPKYRLTIVPVDENKVRIELVMLNQVYLKENMDRLTAGPNHKFYLIVGDSENNLLYYSVFKDKDLLSFYDGCITCDVTRKQNNEHKLIAHCISSNFVGLDSNAEFVFKDLNPPTDNKLNCTLRDSVLKQTNITDLFTRKRKSPKETTQKENKKRDNDVIKQFKNLRQSMETTSKDIKEDLNRAELSMHTNDVNNTSNEHVSDVDIMKILKDIESEIENTNTHSVTQTVNMKDSNMESTSLTAINRRGTFPRSNRKKPKNNFSIIESIQNKYSQNEPVVTESDTGFTNAIKDHLNKFVEDIQNKNQIDLMLENNFNPPTDNVINEIDKYNEIDTSKNTSEPQLAQDESAISLNMDPIKFKTKDKAITEVPPIHNNKKLNTIVTYNENERILNEIKPSFERHLNQLPFECQSMVELKQVNPKLNLNNSIGYNNFLIPIQPLVQDIPLTQRIPVENERNYSITEILDPKSDTLQNRDTFEDDVNQYFFSAIKFNSCTKVLPERQIHIVSRLKFDVNVTEIKTKHSNTDSEYNKNSKHNNVKVVKFNQTNMDGMSSKSLDIEKPDGKKFNDKIKIISNELIEENAKGESNVSPNMQDSVENKQKVVDVKDILQKYQKKLAINTPSQSFNVSTPNALQKKSENVDIKPIRRYKIKDFDKINIPLPETLASVITQSKITQNTNNTASVETIETQNPETPDTEQNVLSPREFEYTINDLSEPSSQNEYDLSQAMLNPKTLLQAVNNVIVPPPPEFTDTYSPTYNESDFNICNAYYNTDDVIAPVTAIDYEPYPEGSIGGGTGQIGGTTGLIGGVSIGPKREYTETTEEWTLSRDPSFYTPYENLQNPSSVSLSQRRAKLSKFKFTRDKHNFRK